VKRDAVLECATRLSDISQHAATLVGLLVIGALACGLGLAFALVVQHVVIDDIAYGASSAMQPGSSPSSIVQTRAVRDPWQDPNLALPQGCSPLC
jgi:hypothetical protein